MAWRVARSLDVLLGQLNQRAPRRNKASDGSIGDDDHQNRSSDHNPWYGPGIVTARDFTHDPAGGLDCHWLSSTLQNMRDARIKYVIWNRRIMSGNPGPSPWIWRAYSGSNPHTQHLHLSVVASPACDNATPWAGIAAAPPPEDDMLRDESISRWDEPTRQVVTKTADTMLGDTYNYAQGAALATVRLEAKLDAELTALRADVAALKARPAADVDESALAAELDARGIGGVTAAELIGILNSARYSNPA